MATRRLLGNPVQPEHRLHGPRLASTSSHVPSAISAVDLPDVRSWRRHVSVTVAAACAGLGASQSGLRSPRRSRRPCLRFVSARAGQDSVLEAELAPGAAAAEAPSLRRRQARKRPELRWEREGEDISSVNVTTPLFYANGAPHIGSAYPTIASDVLARYAQLRGAATHFVTGMDEHGEKIAKTAAGRGQQPIELVDDIAAEFQGLWEQLSVQPNHFVRTTSDSHRSIVNEMWKRCADKGDIYKKDYTGYYCVGCEAYLDADEMLPGQVCPIHQKPCELRREENYFFRLSKYWEKVAAHIRENPDFILPTSRANEVLCWLSDDNKRDFSISRASTRWGIPTPGDDSQVIYVWFDALLGYISSLLQPGDTPTLEVALAKGWPADVHIIGKDIVRFHAIYWPAMLMSAGLPLPKHICTHGFLTKDGFKMGKSLGNVVDPVELVEAFGPDAVRFFFTACLSFGEDVDFSYKAFIKRVNAGLANELGNLVHRLLTLCRKNNPEPKSPLELAEDGDDLSGHPIYTLARDAPAVAARHYEAVDFPKAAATALGIASAANGRITEVEPWAKLKAKSTEEEKREALREMLIMAEAIRVSAVLLWPITPDLCLSILTEFGAAPPQGGNPSWADTEWRWDALPGLCKGKKPKPLFQRIDAEPWAGK